MRILKPFNTISAVVDDDLEKSNRRNKTLLPANEKEIREHFKICLKMHAENKISAKNAWNLKIIDYMYIILYSKRLTKDLLQVAGTSLDACTKIYGIRVDDIHSNGLKLASNMARVDTPRNTDNPEEGDNNTPEDGDKENEAPKRKKKTKRINLAQKMTVLTKDPESLLDDVIKLESVFFQTHKNLESSSTNTLFTNKLPMHPCGHKFMLLSKKQAWKSYDNVDRNIQLDKKYPFEVSRINNLQICAPFADFEIDEWDPNHEDHLLPEEGISIPNLDGSVHDIFASADAKNQYGSSEEEEGVGQAAIQSTEITHIVDFKPEENGVYLNEYSYSTSVNLVSNKRITQVWAGPSHWRLKHIQPTISRFSGQQEKQTCKPTKRAKIQPTLINFLDDLPDLDKTKLFKSQRFGIEDDPFKCTLPQILSIENQYRSLMLKPVFICNNNVTQYEANKVPPYNYYENPNDSQYCPQNGVVNDNDGPYDNGNFQSDEVAIPQQNFLEDNLIDAPELVPKTYIPYALHAKKMNMKKLKAAVWKTLVSEKPNEIIPDEGMYKKKVQNTTFSNMYKQLPGRITEKMKKELSCPLAFVALLHLSNEQNLKLVRQPDFKDFSIQQEMHFTRS